MDDVLPYPEKHNRRKRKNIINHFTYKTNWQFIWILKLYKVSITKLIEGIYSWRKTKQIQTNTQNTTASYVRLMKCPRGYKMQTSYLLIDAITIMFKCNFKYYFWENKYTFLFISYISPLFTIRYIWFELLPEKTSRLPSQHLISKISGEFCLLRGLHVLSAGFICCAVNILHGWPM